MDKKHLPPDEVDPERANLHRMCWREADPPVPPTKHDYVSLAPYYWPNPDTADGMPYVSRDGQVNPEVQDYDSHGLQMVRANAETLTLAWKFTGKAQYAERAAELLRVWFINPDTAMNPHLQYAQHTPGNGGFKSYYAQRYIGRYKDGREFYAAYGGMIDGNAFPALLEVVRILAESGAWSDADDAALRDWFHRYMRWMLESQLAHDEATALNNHASWYCAQLVATAAYCNDKKILMQALNRDTKVRIMLQIEPDGMQPSEMGRAVSFRYVNFALASFYQCAAIAENVGTDLWNYETEDGRGIRVAAEWLIERVKGEKEFTGKNIHGLEYVLAAPLIRVAALKYDRPDWAAIINELPGYPENHRYRLLYPA